MKKILLILNMFVFSFVGVWAAEPTTDYLYATGLEYDDVEGLYYFDVCLEGENFYTGYGVDVVLPEGMEVVEDEYGIFVDMIKTIYPSGRGGTYTHTVSPNFPYPDNHSHLRVGCMSTANADLKATSGPLFRVYVNIDYTPNTWPLGAIHLYDVELNKVGAPYNAEEQRTIVALHTGETTLPLSISSSAQWATCILPFATNIPIGVEAYVVSGVNDASLYLAPVSTFEAYTPYLIHSSTEWTGMVTGNVSEDFPQTSSVASHVLRGAIINQTVTEGFILQQRNDGIMFCSIVEGDSFDFPAGKCWMELPASMNIQALDLLIADPTGLRAIDGVSEGLGTDLLGRKAKTSDNGIYIQNHHKIINSATHTKK